MIKSNIGNNAVWIRDKDLLMDYMYDYTNYNTLLFL